VDKRTITFKLDSVLAEELASQAADQNTSIHKVARQMVVNTIKDVERFATLHEIECLRDQIGELRLVIATGISVLLVQAGKVQDPKEADDWVRRTILGQ
jgi:uncharacterized protein with PhoU and TrkA domain